MSLYRDPPKDGVVVCTDEMDRWPPFHGEVEAGAKNLLADLAATIGPQPLNSGTFAPHTGHAVGFPNSCKTGEAVLAFLKDSVVPQFGGDRKLYLTWDNFSAHKRALNPCVPKPANIEFLWTPTNVSWLNLIEPWFLVLEKTALHNTDLKTTTAINENLLQGIAYLIVHPKPYRWNKAI